MISPHTPPGTKVVLLRAGAPVYGDQTKLKVGSVLTIVKILENPIAKTGFVAQIDEEYRAFDLSLLRRLDLPESLTSLLNTKPHDKLIDA